MKISISILATIAATAVPTSASAAPSFSFLLYPFVPNSYSYQTATFSPNSTVTFRGTIFNIGRTNITRMTGVTALPGPNQANLVFGTTGIDSLNSQFTGISIRPGQAFSFVFATATYSSAPAGTYAGLTAASLSLGDTTGGSPFISAGDLPIVKIAAVPEPATWGMMVLGFAAMGYGLRRRRSREAVVA